MAPTSEPDEGGPRCACGGAAESLCFFTRPDPHGVCGRCGAVRLIQLETGQTIHRFVCHLCWEYYRRYRPRTPSGDPMPVRKL